jgi:hypothetical protein
MRLESWIYNKVYKPIAQVQGFYRPLTGGLSTAHATPKQLKKMAANKELELIVPKISWQQQDLTSNQSVMSFLEKLTERGMVSKSTLYPMLGLDPEVEKKNLERERGSVFDENAPKEGPLPNEGKKLNLDFETGSTIVENIPEEEKPMPRPVSPGNMSINNNPEDFGFPSANINNKKLTRHGHTLEQKPLVSEGE